MRSLALATVSCASDQGPNEAPGPGNAREVAGAPIVGAASCTPNQPVLAPDTTNARDLGGTPLAEGRAVACGAIYRGPPLRLSSEGACESAAQLSLRTLLDLRLEGERSSAPDASCVEAERVFAPLPIPYGLAAADYLNVLHETSSIALVFHTFGDPRAYPIYFHCTFGRDRTGVVGALLLLALGATRSTVMHEYLLSQPNVGAYPESLNAVLDEVEQQGGVEAVLSEAGISDAELAVLREKSIAVQ